MCSDTAGLCSPSGPSSGRRVRCFHSEPRLVNGLSEHILSRTFSLPVGLVQSGRCDVSRSTLKTLSDSFFLCLDEDFCPMTQSSARSNYDGLGMSRPAPASCCSLPRSVFPPVPLFLTTVACSSMQQAADHICVRMCVGTFPACCHMCGGGNNPVLFCSFTHCQRSLCAVVFLLEELGEERQ